MLGTDVNDNIANYITAQLLFLEGQDKEKPNGCTNSPGGSVTAGMAIYDTMQFVEPEVGTICMGLGAAMGQFLPREPRQALCPAPRPHHDAPAPGGVQGQATDIAIQAEQMAYTKRLSRAHRAAHRPDLRDDRS